MFELYCAACCRDLKAKGTTVGILYYCKDHMAFGENPKFDVKTDANGFIVVIERLRGK